MLENKKQAKLLFKVLAGCIILFWTLNNLSLIAGVLSKFLNVIFPLILGFCFAFVINIPMKFFERKMAKIKKLKPSFKRFLSIILSIVVMILLVAFIIRLLVPQLINAVSLLLDKTPYLIERLKIIVNETLNNQDIKNAIQNIDIDTENIKEVFTNNIGNIIDSSINIVSKLIRSITNFIIAIVFAFHILLGKEKIKKYMKKILNAFLPKKKAEYILKISRLSNETFKRFITCQVTEACILGTLCAIGMFLLRIPYAATIGTLVGFTALVPIVGAFIGVIIGALLIVSVDPIKAIIFVIFFIVLQQFEGNIIYPKVVGTAVGVPGILVLFAVLVGGKLFGIIGMLVGLPIISIFYTMLKEKLNENEV